MGRGTGRFGLELLDGMLSLIGSQLLFEALFGPSKSGADPGREIPSGRPSVGDACVYRG